MAFREPSSIKAVEPKSSFDYPLSWKHHLRGLETTKRRLKKLRLLSKLKHEQEESQIPDSRLNLKLEEKNWSSSLI